jgi:RNA polymerase sigma-70 factor (ECF subfamily)
MGTTIIADGVLIKHYTEGNQGAFETLLKRHKNRIFSSIYALVGDRYIAEDIFQETFIKIIHSIRTGKYNHEDKFLPWAMRISRNMCIDSIRQRKRLPIVVDSEGNDILNNIGIFEKSQEELHIANDEITMLRKWIWELPEEQREVLVLRNYADLSFKEIAVVTNTNINTCIGRMHYALINLRKMTKKNSVRVK